MPPQFAFGAWWSRYWSYTDQEFDKLIQGFRTHETPLDVLVIDMDWHPTFDEFPATNKMDASGHKLGWTVIPGISFYSLTPIDSSRGCMSRGLGQP